MKNQLGRYTAVLRLGFSMGIEIMIGKLLLAAVSLGAFWAEAADATVIFTIDANTQQVFSFKPPINSISFGYYGTGTFALSYEETCAAASLCGTTVFTGITYFTAPSSGASDADFDPLAGGRTRPPYVLTGVTFGPVTGGTIHLVVAAPASAAIPEPASWAMFIGGFGLVGSALRRRGQVGFA